MANPQKENGHTSIANEIIEALARTNLNGYETRYLWVLFRKTYGWHKTEDIITNSQFSEATGIKRPHIWRTEKALIKRNIVTKLGNKLGFRKDYTQWRELPRMVTVTQLGTRVTQSGNKELPKMVHTKETTKETIQKKHSAEGAEVIHLFEEIDSKNKTYYANTTQRACADFLLREYGLDKIKQIIGVIKDRRGSKGFPSITSPYEMKEKWTKVGEALMRQTEELKSKQYSVIL